MLEALTFGSASMSPIWLTYVFGLSEIAYTYALMLAFVKFK